MLKLKKVLLLRGLSAEDCVDVRGVGLKPAEVGQCCYRGFCKGDMIQVIVRA